MHLHKQGSWVQSFHKQEHNRLVVTGGGRPNKAKNMILRKGMDKEIARNMFPNNKLMAPGKEVEAVANISPNCNTRKGRRRSM